MRAKVASADSRLSALKVQLEEKEAALANATKGLTEHRQNLTKESIRANESETENSLMRAKMMKADVKLSALKDKIFLFSAVAVIIVITLFLLIFCCKCMRCKAGSLPEETYLAEN